MLLLLLFYLIQSDAQSVLSFPKQFTAELLTTAHQISKDTSYPHRYRRMKIYYDSVNNKARADITKGFEAGRIYYRRYDEKSEYLIETGEYETCQRSYLGEKMPLPELPQDAVFSGKEELPGLCSQCERFTAEEDESRTHIWKNIETGAPVRVTEEWLIRGEDGELQSEPLMTYELKYSKIGPPPDEVFELPSPYTHKSCTRQPGGFPYIHAFHYYLRF
eukprot:g1590.t1